MTDSPSIADSPAARPVALVTGAARRIGAAIASHLHAGGYDVIVHYRSSSQEATDLVDALNRTRAGSATAIGADLSRAADCAAACLVGSSAIGPATLEGVATERCAA